MEKETIEFGLDHDEYSVDFSMLDYNRIECRVYQTKNQQFGSDQDEELFTLLAIARGVLETRVYFEKDQEFWGQDISTLGVLIDKHITPKCKEYFIKAGYQKNCLDIC